MEQNPNTASSEQAMEPRRNPALTVLRIIGKTIAWLLLIVFTLCVIGVLTLAIFGKIFMTYVDTTLIPSLGEISYEEMTMRLASTIYAQKNGEWVPVATLYDNSDEEGGNRELIEYEDLPDHLVQALVAIEDKRFWQHQGVDWIGTAASIRDTLFGGNTRGGSTITQQVLRDITQDTEVTVSRKFREIFRALEFEKVTRKEDIITEYLNRVFFGSKSYGIQKAAQTYFGKDASELDLAESAAIIGITNNPSLYDPFRDVTFKTGKTPRQLNKERQEIILNAMCEQGMIDEATRDAAKAEKLLFTDTPEYKALHGEPVSEPAEGEEGSAETVDTSEIYSWYVDAAINEAAALVAEVRGISEQEATLNLYRAGYHIYLAQDLSVQEKVDNVFEDPSNFDYPSGTGASLDSAITVIDPYTGDVKAMAGGVGIKTVNRGLNLATSRRQPGSAIKPVSVYAPAIDMDYITPASIIDDYPLRMNDSGTGGFPRNAPQRYRGNVTVTTGVQVSINTVASRVMEKMGYSTSFEFMENNLGFDLDPNDIALSPLAMGGLTRGVTTVEMAAAYASFMNKGVYNDPRIVVRIESNDHSEVIVDNTVQSRVAMKETTSYLITKLLRNVVTGGTGRAANLDNATVAGKTGTTNDAKDLYFAGYTGHYAAAVWTGYAEKPEKISYNGTAPATKIWAQVMESLHEGLEDVPLPERPDGITTVTVCADCGLRPNENGLCSADYRGSRLVSAEIQASAAPKEYCTCHVEVQVCTDSETGEVHLAGEYCPEYTVTARVMLAGRTYIGTPDGSGVEGSFSSIIHAEDDDAHATYLAAKGPCPIHDENFVPEPDLPGEGEDGEPGEEPKPGDPDYQWPVGPFDPDSVLPQQPGDTDPGDQPDTQQPAEPSEPSAPEGPDGEEPDSGEPGGGEGEPSPQEPGEPELPEEPALP